MLSSLRGGTTSSSSWKCSLHCSGAWNIALATPPPSPGAGMSPSVGGQRGRSGLSDPLAKGTSL
eukprot:1192118-Prorocentrum_minimum.AAC.1